MQHSGKDEDPFIYSIIRFDNKGFRVHSAEELLHYFHSARFVERINVFLSTPSAVSSNNSTGSYIELRLDSSDFTACGFQVSSDDSEWVDASFCALGEPLKALKNLSGWFHNQWFGFFVQLIGVAVGFALSLWGAAVIAPNVPMEGAFVIVLLFFLILFSNVWEYIRRFLWHVIDKLFGNIKFFRPEKDKYYWLKQAIVAGIVVAVFLLVFGEIITYARDVVSEIFRVDA